MAPEPIPAPRKRTGPKIEPPKPTVVDGDTYKGARTAEKPLAPKVPKPKPGPKLVPSTPTEVVEPIAEAPVTIDFTTKMIPTETREGWLLQAIERIKPTFEAAGHPVPPVRVSIGWPGGRGKKTGVIGQCWFAPTVEDGIPALFISPVLRDPVQIVSTLIHEMAHAALGVTGHRSNFARIAGKVGLVAPWTATGPSEPLKGDIARLIEVLGPFPHAGVNGSGGLLGNRPKVQTTRMLKLGCIIDDYTVRTTAKWIAVGYPLCPWGHQMTEATASEGE